jgi:hypothetical protein
MAITLASAAAYRIVQLVCYDAHGERVTKTFLIGAEAADNTIISMLTNFVALTNCRLPKGRMGGRKISGLPAVVTGNQYDAIGMMVVLTFSQVSPENGELTLYKEFVIPCPVTTLMEENGVTLVTPDADGTDTQKALKVVVDFLKDELVAYIKSADTVVTGGWDYIASASGLISSARKYDELPG